MQSIWKGHISFGLVSVPVSLVSATSQSKLHFKMLHEKDMSPIRYRKVCEEEGLEVSNDEIVRGYEWDENHYVVLNDEDFEKADVTLTRTIDIVNFVKASQLEPMWFDRPYYLEPREAGKKPYVLLRRALKESGYVGIAKTVLRNREHLAALMPFENILLLMLLRFSNEIRGVDRVAQPGQVKVEKKELELAKELIKKLAEEFDYSQYSDEYQEKLMNIIKQKAEGREVVTPPKEKVPEVENLMEALQKSLTEAA